MRAALMLMAVRTGVPLHFRTRARIQQKLLELVIQHPESPAARPPGALLSTFRDDAERLALAIDWPFDAFAGLVFWIVGVVILWSVSRELTLMVFLPLVAVVAVASAARTRLTRLMANRREATGLVTGFLWDAWVGRDSVVASGAEERVVQHLGRLNAARRAAELRDRRWTLALDAVFAGTGQTGTALVLLAAAAALQQGRFSIGAFALFATYLLQVVQYIAFVGYLMDSARDAGVAVQRLGAAASPRAAYSFASRGAPTPPLPPLREFTGRATAGAVPRRITVCLRPGGLTIITGGVASGKTTLLRLLMGLIDGDVFVAWNGARVDPHGLRPPRVAYVTEQPHFQSGSLRDNLDWAASPSHALLEAAVSWAALDAAVASFPWGLDTPVGVGGQALSGGQATRVALARALAHQPDLLVADSFAHALDADTELRLWEGLAGHGMAVLAVSVRPRVLNQADEIIDLSAPGCFVP